MHTSLTEGISAILLISSLFSDNNRCRSFTKLLLRFIKVDKIVRGMLGWLLFSLSANTLGGRIAVESTDDVSSTDAFMPICFSN